MSQMNKQFLSGGESLEDQQAHLALSSTLSCSGPSIAVYNLPIFISQKPKNNN